MGSKTEFKKDLIAPCGINCGYVSPTCGRVINARAAAERMRASRRQGRGAGSRPAAYSRTAGKNIVSNAPHTLAVIWYIWTKGTEAGII